MAGHISIEVVVLDAEFIGDAPLVDFLRHVAISAPVILLAPPERQADVVHMVELMEEQHRSDLRLPDEDVAELCRRLAEKNPEAITLAEFKEHIRHRYGV